MKACIAKQTQQYEFPDRDTVNRSYTHNLIDLVGLAGPGLKDQYDAKIAGDNVFKRDWAIVSQWHEDDRYRSDASAPEARDFVGAVGRIVRMDTAELVEDKRKEGEALLRALDSAGFPVSSAFWFRLPETNDWRLIIASPMIRDKGPDYAYQKVQGALSELDAPRIQLTDIWLVKDTEPLVKTLRSVLHTGPAGVSNVTVRNTSASGVYIDSAHVYRST